MSQIACPYCYHRFAPARQRFQCTGSPAPGRPSCDRIVDAERDNLTGFNAPALPTFEPLSKIPRRRENCPECGGRTGIRACPVCRTPLPANFADSRSPLIGLVGGKNAGKTIYTTVLVHELRARIRRRFGADIAFAGEQSGVHTSTWRKNYEQALFDEQRLFESTTSAANGIRTPLVLQWRGERRGVLRRTCDTRTLSFYDSAGEDMATQDFVNGQAYLGASDGLIVLLDPFQLPGVGDRISVPSSAGRETEPPLSVLNRITGLLRSSGGVPGKRRIAVPLAVVFSKMDAFYEVLGGEHPLLREPAQRACYDEVAGRDTSDHLAALLAELGADDIDDHLRAHYRSFRYFAVSSLGAEPDYDGGRVDPAGVRPFRVDEPLLWLLGKFGIVERRTR